MAQKQENDFAGYNNPFMLHSWYHDYWWCGYINSRGVSSYFIGLVLPEYLCSNTRRVDADKPYVTPIQQAHPYDI